MNKRTIKVLLAFLFMAIAAYGTANASPISPADAIKTAMELRATQGTGLRAPASSSPEIVFTSLHGSDACYYVVNYGGDSGFAIVSADDRLPAVLGYSQEGTFDADNIPCNVKWWLDSYNEQISAWMESPELMAQTVTRPSMRAAAKPIAPICTTKWNQDAPFNNTCPQVNGYRCVTGCVATAMAQVMKAYNWPEKAVGSHGGVVFEGTEFDWANMLDVYNTGKYNTIQANAVATLMRQCGASVDMNYSPYESGAYTTDVQYAWFTYFGYDEGICLEYRDFYSFSQWNEMVYKELAAGRPVLYSGYAATGGHAFVCDGYRSNDFFHLNWGWGGAYDGYFLLNALNPGTGGIGSHEGGYNSGQMILTNVVKAGEGSGKRQMNMISNGGFSYVEGQYRIIDNSHPLIYNPHAYDVTCAVGVKVTNVDDPSKVYYFYGSGGESTYAHNYGLQGFSATISGLPDGNYRVTPASKSKNYDWQDIGVYYNSQTYVALNVKGGVNTLSNPPIATKQAELIINSIEYAEGMKGGGNIVLNVYISNVGDGDYFGKIETQFKDWDNDYFMDTFTNFVSLPSQRTSTMTIIGSTAFDANFCINFVDNNGNQIGEPFDVTLGIGEQLSNETKFSPGSISPNFGNTSEKFSMSTVISNQSGQTLTDDVKIDLFRMGEDTNPVDHYYSGEFSLAPYSSITMATPERSWAIPAGSYYWEERDSSGKFMTGPWPLKLVTGPIVENGVSYYIESQDTKTAYVGQTADGEPYKGTVVIPSSPNGYTISSIQGGLFTFADQLESISIPSSVKNFNRGEFYCAKNLRMLEIRRQNPPVVPENILPADRFAEVTLSVPDGCANTYKRTEVWERFNMPTWKIDCQTGISVVSGFQKDSNGQIYSPYYVSPKEQVALVMEYPEGEELYLVYTVDGKEFAKWYGTERNIKLPAVANGNAIGTFTNVAPAGVEIIGGDDAPASVYDMAGVCVLRSADADAIHNLAPGIYIYKGRKLIVK